MTDSIWYWIRLSRSGPIGNLENGSEAARIYRAALQQFEELMKASESTGPSSRPLTLFYALSQAGRAICAAHGVSHPRGHGLTLDPNPGELFSSTVRPSKHTPTGQFQAVANAVGSPSPSGPVELGALMASLPELCDELMQSADWARALPVWPVDWEEYHVRNPEWIPALVVFGEEITISSDVIRDLKRYPTAQSRAQLSRVEAEQLPEMPRTPTPDGMGVRVYWRDEGRGLDSVFPEYRFRNNRWLRPAVEAESPPPTPIAAWWLLLFGLSVLARYHPVLWVYSLDPDESPLAVPLERAMDEAIRAVPHLVLEALIGRPVVLPPR